MTRKRLVQKETVIDPIGKEATAVADATKAGMVDGVEVNFRHSSLESGDWEARSWWYVGAADRDHSGFIFPSETEAWIRHEPKIYDEELQREKLSLPRAQAGDRLTVENVVDRISDRRFDHRHDATVKEAYLVLTRPNGEQIRPAGPLAFYGKTQLRGGPEMDAYDRLAERIIGEHGNFDVTKREAHRRYRSLSLTEWDFSLSARAALAIEDAERLIAEFREKYITPDTKPDWLLAEVLSQVTLAAFFQAKHEMRKAEEGLAKGPSARKAKDGRLEKAQRLWGRKPRMAINEVAKQVVELIYAETNNLVDKSSIIDSIWRAHDKRELVVPDTSPSYRPPKG